MLLTRDVYYDLPRLHGAHLIDVVFVAPVVSFFRQVPLDLLHGHLLLAE